MVSLVLKACDTKPRFNTDLTACRVISEMKFYCDDQTRTGEEFRVICPLVSGSAG